MKTKSLLTALLLAFGAISSSIAVAQPREEKVHKDREKVEAEGFWIYNDLPKAFAEAKSTGKPMLVVLRCIPCEECVKLDDEILDQDKRIRPLLDKFTRVRVVSTNNLDLSLFQFDTDQSFAVFLLNADGTIYGRFGTRSHRTVWADDVSIDGLAKAMEGALHAHANYPKNKADFAGKRGPAPEFPVPEQFPSLKSKYGPKLDTGGKVVKSCIHCHQIGDAERELVRGKGGPFPERVLFPYPHPKAIGLILDPKERAKVLRVEKGSVAEMYGLQAGDVIYRMQSQPLLSLADVQWVLNAADPDGATIKTEIGRGLKIIDVTLDLPKGWRQRDDISWRASSWGLRRMATGGLLLKSIEPEDRKKLGIAENEMALKVEHVGQFAPHDGAKQAGFQKGDTIVSVNDKRFVRETDLLAYVLTECKPDSSLSVAIVRDGKRRNLTLAIPR